MPIAQNVFRCIARWPSSSYSLLDTHIFLKVSNDAKMLPPIHVEYSRSCGAEMRILISLGASFFTSESNRSPKPLNSVDPPERTMFWKRSFRRSMSDLWMAKTRHSWRPSYSSPIRSGRKRTSGARNRAGPISRVDPSGSTKLCLSIFTNRDVFCVCLSFERLR